MTAREARIKTVFLVMLVLVYSVPFGLVTYYIIQNLGQRPIWDHAEFLPSILLAFAQRQQVLLDFLQRLLIPLVVVLSAIWVSKESKPLDGQAGGRSIYMRYILGGVALALLIFLIFDYVIIDIVSTYDENGMENEKNAMLSYLTNGIENAIVILALVIGINPKK